MHIEWVRGGMQLQDNTHNAAAQALNAEVSRSPRSRRMTDSGPRNVQRAQAPAGIRAYTRTANESKTLFAMKQDSDGIRTPAGRAQWIASPSP